MLHSKLTNIRTQLGPERIDAFVCCASYEERCLSIPRSLDAAEVARPIICVNRDYLEVAKPQLDQIQTLFGDRHLTYELNTGDPLLTADRIVQALSKVLEDTNVRRIIVDVTAFTRESTLIMLRYLYMHNRADMSIEFLYANAGEYSVGDEVENKWLSKGHKEVRSVLGYSGLPVPSKQTHLIVLVGFEDERALTLVHECEPAKITLGVGDASDWATGPSSRYKR